MEHIKALIVGETIIKMLPDQVVFCSTLLNQNALTTFYIPSQFRDRAIEFYDLYLEQGYPTVFLACRGSYDVAIRLNVQDGNMVDWHYTK